MRQVVLTLGDLKSQRLVFRLYRGKQMNLLRFSWKWCHIVRLPIGIQKNNSLHYLQCLLHMFLYQNCHRSPFSQWHQTFLTSFLGNLTFKIVQTILFLNTLNQMNNLPLFSGKWEQLYFLLLYNLNTNLWPFMSRNVRTMCRI